MPTLKLMPTDATAGAPPLAPSRIVLVDIAVVAYIIGMGAFQITHYLHTADYVYDASYVDLARSLLETGSYQLRHLPQTTLPPGFAMILAVVGLVFGLTPGALLPVVAVSSTLGLIAAYEFLRRIEGRAVAAGACLLLASSPSVFTFVTFFVYPEMTYFLLTIVAFLIAVKVDRAGPESAPFGKIALLSLLVIGAVMVRSVGVALLAGLAAWIFASFLLAPGIARRRVARMLAPLVLGMSAQLGWSVWAQRNQVLEWNLPGYPESYLSQLLMKDGHYPELGRAHASDFPGRIGQNMVTRAAGFVLLLTRRYVSPFWPSPAIAGALLLVAWGWASSIRLGGQLHDWYFLFYEAIFLAWPWTYNDRFLIPVFPLACLYLWRGIKALIHRAVWEPQGMGTLLVVLGLVLSVCSAAFAAGWLNFATDAQHVRGDYLQPLAATVFWLLVAAVGFVMIRVWSSHQVRDRNIERLRRLMETATPLVLRLAGVTALAFLVVTGTAQAVVIGRQNMTPQLANQSGYPMIEAAEWIRTHEPPNSVVMARDVEFIFHYTRGRVVWFPPISDPRVLMDGIRRYKVNVILVVHHENNYWLPSEVACFQSLLKLRGDAFRLLYRGSDSWVYQVLPIPARN